MQIIDSGLPLDLTLLCPKLAGNYKPEAFVLGSHEPNRGTAFSSASRDEQLSRLRFQQGLSEIEKRLEDCSDSWQTGLGLTPDYATALETWCSTSGSIEAFDEVLVKSLEATRQQRWSLIRMLQPLIWLIIATCSFSVICILFIPNMQRLYQRMGMEPGPVLELLSTFWAKTGLSILWVPIALTLIAACFYYFRFRRSGVSKANGKSFSNRNAVLAAQAMRMAVGNDATETSNSSNTPDQTCGTSGAMLRWSSSQTALADEAGRKERLLFAARSYKAIGQLSRDSRDLSAQSFLTILLAGVLVLLTCLAVFIPVINLLIAVGN